MTSDSYNNSGGEVGCLRHHPLWNALWPHFSLQYVYSPGVTHLLSLTCSLSLSFILSFSLCLSIFESLCLFDNLSLSLSLSHTTHDQLSFSLSSLIRWCGHCEVSHLHFAISRIDIELDFHIGKSDRFHHEKMGILFSLVTPLSSLPHFHTTHPKRTRVHTLHRSLSLFLRHSYLLLEFQRPSFFGTGSYQIWNNEAERRKANVHPGDFTHTHTLSLSLSLKVADCTLSLSLSRTLP